MTPDPLKPEPRKPGTATEKAVAMSLLAGLVVLALVLAAVKHIDEIPLGPILPVAFVVAVVLTYRSARSPQRTVALSLLAGLLVLVLVLAFSFAGIEDVTPTPRRFLGPLARPALPPPEEGLCGDYYQWYRTQDMKARLEELKRRRELRQKAQSR